MRNLFYILLFFFLLSCEGTQEKEATTVQEKKPLLSVVQKHFKTTSVNPIFKKEVEDWKEYQTLTKFIKQYKNCSPNEALSNALELRDLVKNTKDSVKPKVLETPALIARVNILYNESLRLSDMTKISAIKAEEVNLQVDKILSTYSSLNEKINTVFSQKKFEDLITIDNSFIGLDTTKIDSVSRKNIFIEEETILNNRNKNNKQLFKKTTTKSLLFKKRKKMFQAKNKIKLKNTQQ